MWGFESKQYPDDFESYIDSKNVIVKDINE